MYDKNFKQIKFLIWMKGAKIRNLDELRDNYNSDEAVRMFKEGLLERWLDAHGFTEKRAALAALDKKMPPKETREALWKIIKTLWEAKAPDSAVTPRQLQEKPNETAENRKQGQPRRRRTIPINAFKAYMERSL